MPRCPSATFSGILFGFQVILLILFATLGDYGPYADPVIKTSPPHGKSNSIPYFYPIRRADEGKKMVNTRSSELSSETFPFFACQSVLVFQDIHVMIFVGFGFLMTFLKKYGYGSVSYNLFIGAVILQWSTIINSWMRNAFEGIASAKFSVDIKTMITSDFAAAAVLITFGAVLGKISRLQLLITGFVEIIFFALNENVLSHKLHVSDVGGSMVIHAFGAYFGLAVARMVHSEDIAEESSKEGSSYNSDLFSMIGTVFLWMFWPSFNAGMLGPGTQQNRAVINTYYSLSACVILTFVVSPLVNKNSKISMVHVQNATLAGGVAVGTMADMVLKPWGAIFVGMAAGTLSTLGYAYVTPFLLKRLKMHDTCGVNNLHGMPGILSAVGGAIAAAVATEKKYGNDLYSIWPARMTVMATNTTVGIKGRTAGAQAGFQIVALLVTIALAIAGGVITGLIVKFIDPPSKNQLYDDNSFWVMPDDDEVCENGGEMHQVQEASKPLVAEEKV